MAVGRPRNAMFFGRNLEETLVIKFQRRLKEAHLRFLDFKKLENIEKAGTRVTNCKFAKNSSIRAILFKG